MVLTWEAPPSVIAVGLTAHGARVHRALIVLANVFAQRIASYARQHAPWTDRTGDARAGLTGVVESTELAVTIILFHKVSYGIWLEIAHAGRWGIIRAALAANQAAYMKSVEQLIR